MSKGSSKTINQDLLIATKGTLHAAETPTPTDLLYTEDKSKKINHHNYIITQQCDDAQATQKTFIRNHRIIHLESKIGQDFGENPSQYLEPFVGEGGGVYNGGFHHKHAKATRGSPNVIVEGNPLVRTDDPTEQNRNKDQKHNTNGKVKQIGGALREEDLESLLSKGCTVESVTTSCPHGKDGARRTTTTDRLEVLEGDVVKLVMVHVNDAEVDEAPRARPKCQVPRRKREGKISRGAQVHPNYRVQRGAYPATSYREELAAIEPEIIKGLEIELGERWLGKMREEEESPLALETAPAEPEPDPTKPKSLIQRASEATNPDRSTTTGGTDWNLRDVREGAARLVGRGTPTPAEQRAARTRDAATPEAHARAQAENRAEEERERQSQALQQDIADRTAAAQQEQLDANAKAYEQGKAKLHALKESGALFLESWRAVTEVFAAKPIEVKVEALACAGARPVVVAAYPPRKYAADVMALREVVRAFRVISDVIKGVRAFLALLGKDQVAEQEEGAAAPAVAVGLSGKRFKVAISFLADAAASIWMQYRELERDSGLDGEKKGLFLHQVRLAYGVDFTVGKLIGIQFKYDVPIAIALGPLGRFIQEVLDHLDEQQKSGAFVSFDIQLAVGLSGGMEVDQYGKAWLARTGAITPSFRFTLSLVVAVGDYATFEIGVTPQWAPSFRIRAHNDKPFEIVRDPGTIDITWFVKAGVKILGWTVEWNYTGVIMSEPILGGPITIE